MTNPAVVPITGRERGCEGSSPVAALIDFYRAFNERDLAGMELNWASTEDASMDNPLGGIKRGWPEIKAVYQRIFAGAAKVSVEFFDYTLHDLGESFLAVGRERGTLHAEHLSLDLLIPTSRLFYRIDGRWRQIHHHGSIDDAELLAKYQAAVLPVRPGPPDAVT